MKRASADVDRKVDNGEVILHQIAGEPAENAAAEHDQGKPVVMEPQRLVHFFDGEGRVCFHFVVALGLHLPRCRRQCGGTLEFSQNPVDRRDHFSTSATSASGSSVRTSKIEIIGSKRMN